MRDYRTDTAALTMIVLFLCFFFVFQGGRGDRVLIGTDRELLLLDPATNRTDCLQVKEDWAAHAVAYHYSKGFLYYAINSNKTTKVQTALKSIRIPFNNNEKPTDIETRGLVHEVTIDWIEDRIYLLNADDIELQVADLDGNNRSTIITRQKLNEANKTNMIQPPLRNISRCNNLVIDPFERILFMVIDEIDETDRRKSRSFLMTSDLNGDASSLQFLPILPQTVVEINVQQKILYMYRLRDNILLTFNYNEKDSDKPAEFLNSHIYYNFSSEFTVFGSNLYWFNFENNTGDVYKINLFKGVKSQELYFHVQQYSKVFEFLVFEPQVQTNGSEIDFTPQQCDIEGCSHGCRMVGIATCTCPACYKLGDDYLTCQDKVDPFVASSLSTCKKYKDKNNTYTFIIGKNGSTPALTKNGVEPESRRCPVVEHPSRVINWLPCRRGQSCALTSSSNMEHLSLVEINCSPVLRFLSGGRKAFSICQNGTWDPPIPQCFKLCSPLKSQTLELQCWQGSDIVNCNQVHLPNTTATYQCKEYHEASYASQPSGIRCEDDGTWTRELPRCTPKCGLSNLENLSEKPLVEGRLSQPGNFPWHAAIYHNKSSLWEAVCGGTLVSSKIILTAAHCVTVSCQNCKPAVMAEEDIMIALGKIQNNWYISEKTEEKKSVKEIRVHPNYVGSALNYIADVAVVILETDVEINSYIMPACVDYLKMNYYRITPNTEGYIAGWGSEEFDDHSCDMRKSDSLKYSKTGILNFNTCNKLIQSIKGHPVGRITPDKFCSRNASESVVQAGDSGGGLTIQFDGVYYVYGIVSATLSLEMDNQAAYTFAVFTSIPKFLDWLSSSLY